MVYGRICHLCGITAVAALPIENLLTQDITAKLRILLCINAGVQLQLLCLAAIWADNIFCDRSRHGVIPFLQRRFKRLPLPADNAGTENIIALI